MPIIGSDGAQPQQRDPRKLHQSKTPILYLVIAIVLIPIAYLLVSSTSASTVTIPLLLRIRPARFFPAHPSHCTKAFPFSPSSKFSTTRLLAAAEATGLSSTHRPPQIERVRDDMVYDSKSGSPPQMSAKEEKEWNHLADGMSYYHDHFKHSFGTIYDLADGKFERRGISLPAFLRDATSLASHLEMHHTIEEKHIFPILARRMPEFRVATKHGPAGGKMSSQLPDKVLGAHLLQHKQIHAGLDEYEGLLKKYREDNAAYDPRELRACMDGFREVLFAHLDEEVATLGGESMRRAGWTLEEIRKIPM